MENDEGQSFRVSEPPPPFRQVAAFIHPALIFHRRKILFEGLKIMPLEQEWAVYPVFHLDLSVAKSMPSANDLQTALSIMLRPWHDQYGGDRQMSFPGQQLMDVISKAYNQTSKQVVIKIGRCNVKLNTFTKRLLSRNYGIYIL